MLQGENKTPRRSGEREDIYMKLPTFAEFQEDFNIDKMLYDMENTAPNSIKASFIVSIGGFSRRFLRRGAMMR